jgi:hypothetical protein
MEKTLHILNGDSTKIKFDQSRIAGDTAVWREVLSDGPVFPNFGSEEFWNARMSFFLTFFSVVEMRYEKDVISEFKKIENFHNYNEVVLWFEYDLFCQINLIGLLSWFKHQELRGTKISLICVGWEEGFEGLVDLGQIPTEDYTKLFKRRRILGSNDFNLATDAYLAYCSENLNDLETFILLPSNEFPYLAAAFESHLRRFPSAKSGLNLIEEKIIALIEEDKTNLNSLIGDMLKWQQIYGFGDLQYLQYLEQLKPLFDDFENLGLKADFSSVEIDRNYKLGGVKVADWLWDENEQTIKLKAQN